MPALLARAWVAVLWDTSGWCSRELCSAAAWAPPPAGALAFSVPCCFSYPLWALTAELLLLACCCMLLIHTQRKKKFCLQDSSLSLKAWQILASILLCSFEATISIHYKWRCNCYFTSIRIYNYTKAILLVPLCLSNPKPYSKKCLIFHARIGTKGHTMF